MTLMAGVYAVVAAIGGTVVWAIITNLTGYQIGWMAIGMGALVGAGVRFGGGEGKPAALFAGGLALVGMFLGNLMAASIALDSYIKEEAQLALTQEAYTDAMTAANEFVLTPEEKYPEFILAHTFISAADSPEGVTAAEIQQFKEVTVPELRRLHNERPDFSTWRNQEYVYARAVIKSEVNLVQFVFEDLGIIGFVFMIIGLVAAVRVVGEWD